METDNDDDEWQKWFYSNCKEVLTANDNPGFEIDYVIMDVLMQEDNNPENLLFYFIG